MKTLNNSLLYSLSLEAYLVDNISPFLNFQWVYSFGERLSYHIRLITYMCVYPLICVWFLACWARSTNFTLVNVLAITSISYLKG